MATSGPGAIHLLNGLYDSSVGWSRPRVLPNEDELAKAAEILNAGSKVAILAGQGAAKAQPELAEVAELSTTRSSPDGTVGDQSDEIIIGGARRR